jgi:cytochrome c-type biogenesis protein CcmF
MVVMDRIISDKDNPGEMKFIITSATRRPKLEYIILKAIEFPYINLLWGGTVIMVFGFCLAIIQRFKESKRHSKNLV